MGSFKKFLKKAKKDLKKAGKKLTKAIGKVAPVLAIVPGVGTLAAGAISAVAGQANSLLNKGGKYTKGIQDKLNQSADQMRAQVEGRAPVNMRPTVERNTTVAVDNLPDSFETQGPGPMPQDAEPTASKGGMDPKTLALVAAAGVAVLFLLRKR